MSLEPRVADRAVPPVHRTRTACRACEGTALVPFLALGDQPLANAFLRSAADAIHEQRYPLDVYFCTNCSLVQLLDVIDAEVLFGEYIYVTGTSETIAAHNREYATAVVAALGMRSRDLVVEIASNDGSLLRCFQQHGVRVLGCDPARNIAQIAEAQGVETVNRFFNSTTAREIVRDYGQAKAVVGNNVLAHVDDTADFLAGARELITEDGRVIVEVPYAREMHERGEYDTVYHEHLCYFTVTSLARLGERVGLFMVRVDHVPVHGGSIRVWFSRTRMDAPQVDAMMAQERAEGLTSLPAWEEFAERAASNRSAVRALLEGLRRERKQVAGYGAPAKGNTLLNYCQIGPDLLPYTVDRSELKVGMLTPGMHIPTLPVSTILDRQPDVLFILAWNFADEIVRQQATYRARGGQCVIPIPTPRYL